MGTRCSIVDFTITLGDFLRARPLGSSFLYSDASRRLNRGEPSIGDLSVTWHECAAEVLSHGGLVNPAVVRVPAEAAAVP